MEKKEKQERLQSDQKSKETTKFFSKSGKMVLEGTVLAMIVIGIIIVWNIIANYKTEERHLNQEIERLKQENKRETIKSKNYQRLKVSRAMEKLCFQEIEKLMLEKNKDTKHKEKLSSDGYEYEVQYQAKKALKDKIECKDKEAVEAKDAYLKSGVAYFVDNNDREIEIARSVVYTTPKEVKDIEYKSVELSPNKRFVLLGSSSQGHENIDLFDVSSEIVYEVRKGNSNLVKWLPDGRLQIKGQCGTGISCIEYESIDGSVPWIVRDNKNRQNTKPLAWEVFVDGTNGFEFEYPIGSSKESRSDLQRQYMIFQNYIDNDYRLDFKTNEYYLEVSVYNHKKGHRMEKSCEQSMKNAGKVKFGEVDGYIHDEYVSGERKGHQRTLCVNLPGMDLYFRGIERSVRYPILSKIFDGLLLTEF